MRRGVPPGLHLRDAGGRAFIEPATEADAGRASRRCGEHRYLSFHPFGSRAFYDLGRRDIAVTGKDPRFLHTSGFEPGTDALGSYRPISRAFSLVLVRDSKLDSLFDKRPSCAVIA